MLIFFNLKQTFHLLTATTITTNLYLFIMEKIKNFMEIKNNAK